MHALRHSTKNHPDVVYAACPPCDDAGSCDTDQVESARLEISADVLRRMLESNVICAADLRCLDCASKRCIWKLCLKACARRLHND